ncbi:MAG: small acid-soluble spore protein N [Anaerobacillus sp.]|jgi:small acid-soluble spore protein N (minor)
MMAKSKHAFDKFRPNHYGTQQRATDKNNAKKMGTKGNEEPDYVPPKG